MGIFCLNLSLTLAEDYAVNIVTSSGSIGNIYVNQSINFSSLNNIEDVNVPTPADDEVLTWDDDNSEWISQSVSGVSKWIINSSNYLYSNVDTLYFNETELNSTITNLAGGGSYVPYSGATSDVDLNNHKLSNVGELIVEGLITSQGLIPSTDDIYSLGNSSNWFSNIYAKVIHSENVSTDFLNASDIDSDNIDSENISTTNFTIGGYKLNKEGEDLVITLT